MRFVTLLKFHPKDVQIQVGVLIANPVLCIR